MTLVCSKRNHLIRYIHQKREDTVAAICHTKPHSVTPVEFSLSNLLSVLSDWGKRVFVTEAEAQEAMNTAVELHKKQLIELGLNIK